MWKPAETTENREKNPADNVSEADYFLKENKKEKQADFIIRERRSSMEILACNMKLFFKNTHIIERELVTQVKNITTEIKIQWMRVIANWS